MDPRVEELLRRFAKAVEPLGVPYAIGGALAMSAHGVTRHTTDVDAFALLADRAAVMRALRGAGLRVVPIMTPHHYAAYLDEHGDPEIRIDVMFPSGEPEMSAIENPVRARVGGTVVNVFPVELLVATKFYSSRIKDELDIGLLYEVGSFEPETVRALIASLDPQDAEDFAALIERLKHPKPPRKRPTRRK